MGNYGSMATRTIASASLSFLPAGLKRSAQLNDSNSSEAMNTPKRRKLSSTSAYIYETLFVNGESSDVTIVALNREWHLHKVYLCQSAYFSSMFKGSWKESNMDTIRLDIPDNFIDEEALDIVFGSLYRDYVFITPAKVVSVLATATLLNLEELIQQCAAIMTDSISLSTVCGLHTAATRYGQFSVAEQCKSYLEKTIMSTQTVKLLNEISVEMMHGLVSSADLFVYQVEMDIYTMLRKWLFLKLSDDWQGEMAELSKATDAYFKSNATDWSDSFLETEAGSEFVPVFAALRIRHIITDHQAVCVLEKDAILPRHWLSCAFRDQWLTMLKVDQGQDLGPSESVSVSDFSRLSIRYGRVLPKELHYIWRWTGYNFGLDIIITFSNRAISIKRNIHNSHGSVGLQPIRHIFYRLTVASFDESGKQTFVQTTGIKKASLLKDQDMMIMGIDRKAVFPLHISCNLLTTNSNPQLETAILRTPYSRMSSPQSRSTSTSPSSSAVITTNIVKQQPVDLSQDSLT